MSAKDLKNRIVWIDLELTSLDVNKAKILEVACLITDSDLHIISDEFNQIIKQPDCILDCMDDWCIENFAKTGLTEASRNSENGLATVENNLLNFIKKYVPVEKTCPLAGSSVYYDRIHLKHHMPQIDQYLHYRIIDVSTVKELARRWKPEVFHRVPEKKLIHRALPDIKESIVELQFYRENLFV